MTESLRELLDKRMVHLRAEREEIEPHWRELRDNFLPGRGRFQGEKGKDRRRVRLPRVASVLAARTMGSGLHAGLTSPARPWIKSTVQDDDLAEWGAVKEWMSLADTRMLTLFARSNLYQALPAMYQEYGVFGTMAALAFPEPASVFRFEPYTVGTYYLARNGVGNYDTLVREFPMTLRQVASRWGDRALTPRLRDKWDRGDKECTIMILHAVEPKGDGTWRSCYYDNDGKKDKGGGLLSEAMAHTNPILAASWETVTGETYASTCPGMIALGQARALQIEERNKAKALERHHNPPMQGPAMQSLSLLPGAYNPVALDQAMGQNGQIRPVHDFKPDIAGLLDSIGTLERAINSSFFVDLFLMLTMDERAQRATAEEIRAKYDEKVLALGPTLEQANAMLRTLHGWAFDTMIRQSRPIWEGRMQGEPILPPPPKELEDVEIIPEFVSTLQQAQRAQTLQGLERFASSAGMIAQMTGKAPEKFDADQWLDEMAAGLGVSPKVVRDDEEVAAMREAEAQAAQMQQMAAMAPALKDAASAGASLADAEPSEGSILSSLAQGMG